MVRPMLTVKRFSAAFARAVRLSGRSKASIAEEARVAESCIRAVENGKCPSVVRADALLRALGRRLVIGDPQGEDLTL